jgi:hypothetical protein
MSGEEKKQKVYVCGTCSNVIQHFDSLQHHLVFTHGCNKLVKNRFPTCACGTTWDNRSNWNHHACPGKSGLMTALFNEMVAKDKNCYREEMGTIKSRAPYTSKSPSKKTPSKTPVKKSTPKKTGSTTKKKKKEKKEKSKKHKHKKQKKEKKEKKEKREKKEKTKKEETESAEERTVSINSDDSDSESSSEEESSTISTSDTESSEDSPSKKRKYENDAIHKPIKKKKFEPTEEVSRQWTVMTNYSRPFEQGNPLLTLSQQLMPELNVIQKPGCITFVKTYTELINSFHGFGRREILKFVKGDSRMFICRDTEFPGSVTTVIDIVNEHNPKVIKLWEEDTALREGIVSSTPYFWVDTIVAPSGNLVGVYTSDNSLQPTSPKEMICAVCLPFNVVVSQGLIDMVTKFEDSMVAHYSASNDYKKSWKGLALQGYTPKFQDLWKPEEMEKAWQKQNSISSTQSYENALQETDLMFHFKYYLTELRKIFPGKMHRIRILCLAPGGKISRHSDKPIQTDLDEGKIIMRYHLPLVTNDNVKMKIWNLHGDLIEIKMDVGYVYQFDSRKPHAVENEGDTNRHHLVFDVELDPALEPIVERSFKISDPHENSNDKFQAWKESTEFAKIALEADEGEKKKCDELRIEMEKKLAEEEKKKNEEIMDVETPASHHSQNLFAAKNTEADEISPKRGSRSNTNSSSESGNKNSRLFSVSDKFEGDEEEDDDDEDTSNYKLGKRTSKNNTPAKEEKKKDGKKQEGADKAEIVTIESDKEEENEDDSVEIDEFLARYQLSQFEESFRKNQLNTPNDFRLLSGKDLKDIGFTPEDVAKWKKFNPDLIE